MAGNVANFGNKRSAPYGKATANKRAPLGQGGRFAYIEQQAAASGAKNPAAVAAAAGRKAHGQAAMSRYSAQGRKTAHHPKTGQFVRGGSPGRTTRAHRKPV